MLMADGYITSLTTRPPARAKRLWQASLALAAIVSVGAVVVLAVYPRPSSRGIASALAHQRDAHEPVLMLGNYGFDLPFYAAIRSPVGVVDDWTSADIGKRDNWRKELADAGRFAPERAQALLIAPASLPARLCASPVSWVIGPSNGSARYPFLGDARAVFSEHDVTLWRVDRALPAVAGALGCAGVSGDGPADK
jgi:hypothetical protein